MTTGDGLAIGAGDASGSVVVDGSPDVANGAAGAGAAGDAAGAGGTIDPGDGVVIGAGGAADDGGLVVTDWASAAPVARDSISTRQSGRACRSCSATAAALAPIFRALEVAVFTELFPHPKSRATRRPYPRALLQLMTPVV
jgi:hypothetical protein